MHRILTGTLLLLILTAGVTKAQDADTPATIVTAPADVQWGDPPPVLEKGASFAVVAGDPSGPGIFVMRLKMPAGYKISPHWHPTDEHVTVISGTFKVGSGDLFDESAMTDLPSGGFVFIPAEARHFAMAKTAATIQITGSGPFVLNYVNPADNPLERMSAQ